MCLACAAYAVPWTKAMRDARALRRFNHLWQARVLMEVVAAFWLVRRPFTVRCASPAHKLRGPLCCCTCTMQEPCIVVQVIPRLALVVQNMSTRAAGRASQRSEPWWRNLAGAGKLTMVVASAQVWVVLRMLALWGVRTRPGVASNRTSRQLCRIFLGFSLGLFQPLFLLLALLLCHTSIA